MENPALDFFLSELSVSDRHGGGLTAQRILDADLDRIACFVHVAKFADDYPPVEQVRARSLTLYTPLDSDALRRRLGWRPTAWLNRRQTLRAWQGRRVARAVEARFPDTGHPLRALVCPQGAESLYAMDALTRRRRVDYLVWVMDDQLLRRRGEAWSYPPGIETLLARLLRGARQVFVISPAMAAFYQARFGVESQVLLPPADASGEPVWEAPRAWTADAVWVTSVISARGPTRHWRGWFPGWNRPGRRWIFTAPGGRLRAAFPVDGCAFAARWQKPICGAGCASMTR